MSYNIISYNISNFTEFTELSELSIDQLSNLQELTFSWNFNEPLVNSYYKSILYCCFNSGYIFFNFSYNISSVLFLQYGHHLFLFLTT